MKKTSLILCICLIISVISSALLPSVSADTYELCLNEICTSASSVLSVFPDADGESSDYVEIYNEGNNSIDISGFGLSDSKNPLKWQFPDNTVIPEGGYLVIFCSGKGTTTSMYKNEYHTSFSIKLGETITLSNAVGEILDSVTSPSINQDTSWSRKPDGFGGSWVNTYCSPNNSNNDSALVDYLPEFSYTSGFYDEPIVVSISHPLGYDIYYTTDFSEPTVDSEKYTEPISVADRTPEENTISILGLDCIKSNGEYAQYLSKVKDAEINKCTVIRAIAVDPLTGEVGQSVTATYFIGIDREALYGDTPVLSITTDTADLFDESTGVYTNARNASISDREIPVNLTYFDGNGNLGFSQNCGVKIRGNVGSRGYMQKGMNIYAREEYGKNVFNYPMIPGAKANGTGEDINKYKRIMLRGGNNTPGLKFIDPVTQSLGKTKNVTSQNWTWCSLYLNGEYWGSYCLQENLHEKNIENHFGVDDDEMIFYKLGNYDNAATLWNNDINWALSDQYSYEEFCNRFDIDSLIDYFAAYACAANSDWPQNNVSAWKSIENKAEETGNPYYDGKWRMNLWDFDMSYELMKSDYFNSLIGESKNLGFGTSWNWNIFKKLLDTPEFKTKFVTKMENAISILYNPNRVRNTYWNEYQKALPFLEQYAERFPDSSYKSLNTGLELSTRSALWISKLEEDMTRYFGFDSAVNVTFQISDHKAGKVYVYGTDSLIPKQGAVKGRYFKEYPVEIKAEPDDGYVFSHWYVCGGGVIDDMNSEEATVILTDDTIITAVFSEVK